jgi:hypothetical protein
VKLFISTLLATFCFILPAAIDAQTITGAWKGKINNTKVELKLIKRGDSLTGTVYYYVSRTSYRRYAVKGYFDGATNDVIWWDDWLIEDHSARSASSPGPRLNVADFNCPGDNEILLDGASNLKDDINSEKKELHLEKTDEHVFNDEWDWVIENYFVGTNHPDIIDSISHLRGSMPFPEEKDIAAAAPPSVKTTAPGPKPQVTIKEPPAEKNIATGAANTPEEKFVTRKKVVQTVIPITAKTIELRFYDNAQVDGDSIALFLNNRMIFKNIRLTDKAYTIKLDASELNDDNELVMVAENLGSIPPNTSFMLAIVGDKRYEARLFANENSSAVIRLVRQE